MKERMKNMKTDIQIAQEAEMSHIRDVAASIGIEEDNLEYTVSIRQNFRMIYMIR